MTSPFTSGLSRNAQPITTAGNSANVIVAVVARAGTVSGVTFTPLTTVTGANTNTRSVTLVNKGNAGSGTAVVATLQFDSGVNATGLVQKTITLSATPANLVVAAGDVLQWQSAAVGTGIADPGGLVSVSLNPAYS